MMDPADRLRSQGRLAADVPLGPLTTYKFGGPASYVIEVDDEASLRDAYRLARAEGMPILALGRGSNVLVADAGFRGVVLRSGPRLLDKDVDEDGVVTAGSAVALPLLARDTARAGRGGLEFYAGIPGSVGGAIRMNAGCHGTETADVLVDAKVFDAVSGTTKDLGWERLGLSYRHSDLDDMCFVISARFATVPSTREQAEARIKEITRWRRAHQPGGTLNAGSVFKNPADDAAGRIIDHLGLKGLRIGGVRVSERHANFFVAEPEATAQDAFMLVEEVRRRVFEATGISLEPELRFVGEFR